MKLMDDSTTVIILSSGVSVSLFYWLWALRYLYKHWCGSTRVSTFVLFLLLSDLPDLGLIPFVFQNILVGPQAVHHLTTWNFSSLFFGTRLYALYLHQLVTLESILCLRHPQCSAQTFTPTKSFIVCLSVWVSVAFFSRQCASEVPLYVSFSVYVVLCLVPLAMAIVTCVPALTDFPINSQTSSHGSRRRAAILVSVVSIVTLGVVYAPLLLVMCLAHYPSSLSDGHDHPFYSVPEMAWVLTTYANGMRVMTDPLLCVLVCSQMKKLRSITAKRDSQEFQTNLGVAVFSQVRGQQAVTSERDVSVKDQANLESE